MTKPIPTPEMLRKLLRYDPETGKLFWRERPVEMFADTGRGGSKGSAARWNGRFSGKEAFTAISGSGYLTGGIFSKIFQAQMRLGNLRNY